MDDGMVDCQNESCIGRRTLQSEGRDKNWIDITREDLEEAGMSTKKTVVDVTHCDF